MRKLFALGAALVAATLLVTDAFAASSYTLFGDASIVSGGNPGNAAQIESSSVSPGYGGVDFTVSGTTFAQLATLSTDYEVTAGDCGGGSPRFQINVDTGSGVKNIFAYLGPEPNNTGCTLNTWSNDGNLVDGTRALDTSHLAGGNFYDTESHALSAYGSYPVVGIQLVADGSWAVAGGVQTVLVDNVQINSYTETFDLPVTKDGCKDDGWKSLTKTDGSSFKNQGDCIQFANTGK